MAETKKILTYVDPPIKLGRRNIEINVIAYLDHFQLGILVQSNKLKSYKK